MRVSEIQRRRSQPTAQPVPLRRTVGWLAIAAAIVAGIYLFFRYAHLVTPLLAS